MPRTHGAITHATSPICPASQASGSGSVWISADNPAPVISRLKADLAGEIDLGGPDLAGSLTEAGLIDEYRLYLHPIVLGRGKPFFAGPRPPLRLLASALIAEDVIRLSYVPA